MPVKVTVTAQQPRVMRPRTRIRWGSACGVSHAQPKASAGAKVTMAATPSRDSHDERHWDSARQARSGWPRWAVDAISPVAMRTKAKARHVAPKARVEAGPCAAPTRPEQCQEAVAHAGGGGEDDDRIGGMHGGPYDRTLSSQPNRRSMTSPLPASSASRNGSAGLVVASRRGRGGRYLLTGLHAHLRQQVMALTRRDQF